MSAHKHANGLTEIETTSEMIGVGVDALYDAMAAATEPMENPSRLVREVYVVMEAARRHENVKATLKLEASRLAWEMAGFEGRDSGSS